MFGCNANEYDLKVELAKCFKGIVYLAEYLPTKDHVAVKKYRMDRSTKEELHLIRDEILQMRQFNHPNILTFYTAFVYNFEVFLVAPLMCYGSCKDTITNCFQSGFPEIIASLIIRDVLNGLEYLHRKGFIHRSIRASHILLNQTHAVISGFRECTNILTHGKRTKTLHTLAPCSEKSLNWLAPEILEQNLLGYNEKSDIYSVGITCCELANGIEPFVDMISTFMLTEKIRGNQPTLLDSSTWCPSEDMISQAIETNDSQFSSATKIFSERKLSDSFHKFSELCMERYPTKRPPVVQLLNHQFIKQCKHTCLFDQLVAYGIEPVEYSKLRDESIGLSSDLSEMNLNGNFEWDF